MAHNCQKWKRVFLACHCHEIYRDKAIGLKSCKYTWTRQFSNHESRLLSRAHTFAIIVILDLKIHQSMWIHWSFFLKTWTKGHWPLHHLWPHVCWGHMCDSTQGSLCPSPMTIHQCMWIQWSILQITTYIHILHTYYSHTTYRMSDHIVSYWTQFRRNKKLRFMCSGIWGNFVIIKYFVNNCLIQVWIWKFFRTYVTHIIVIISHTTHFVST